MLLQLLVKLVCFFYEYVCFFNFIVVSTFAAQRGCLAAAFIPYNDTMDL